MSDRPIVVMTGAGASADSGIATFRGSQDDNNGYIWKNYSAFDVATPFAFANHPERVHAFYNMRRAQLQSAEVTYNAGHEALARLERDHDGSFVLYTQNVDDLHERAGSKNVKHAHGLLNSVKCNHDACDHVMQWDQDLTVDMCCPGCHRVGTLRPNIVWFGEKVPVITELFRDLRNASLFIVVGTSAAVQPMCGAIEAAVHLNVPVVLLNLDNTSTYKDLFSDVRLGKSADVTPAFVDDLLAGRLDYFPN